MAKNADHQRAWRARRKAELVALRERVGDEAVDREQFRETVIRLQARDDQVVQLRERVESLELERLRLERELTAAQKRAIAAERGWRS